MDQSRTKFAGIFRTARKLYKLNQSEFAKRLGITQGTVSKLEKGLLGPDVILWYSFCKEFNLYADITYKTGLLFFKDEVEFKGDEFKMGGLSRDRLIKVKEISPFIQSMGEYELLEGFYALLAEKGIDKEVLLIPEYLVPFEILKEILDITTTCKDSKLLMDHSIKYFIESKYHIVEELGYSYKNLIQYLNENDPYLNIQVQGSKVNINLVSNLRFSLDEQLALKSYIMFKIKCVKQALTDLFHMKGLKLKEINDFSYAIGL